MHPTLEDDISLIASLRSIATEFLEKAGIAVGDDRYRHYLSVLSENEDEFVKVLLFAKQMFPNEDYPDGMTEEDLVPEYWQNYPLIAAVGVIDVGTKFRRLADQLALAEAVPVGLCHDYSLLYFRTRWLADVLTMSNVYQANYQQQQRENARRARQDALNQLITQILEKHPKYTWKEVLVELTRQSGPGATVESVTEEEIEWTDASGRANNTRISALKHRVSRVKHNLGF